MSYEEYIKKEKQHGKELARLKALKKLEEHEIHLINEDMNDRTNLWMLVIGTLIGLLGGIAIALVMVM